MREHNNALVIPGLTELDVTTPEETLNKLKEVFLLILDWFYFMYKLRSLPLKASSSSSMQAYPNSKENKGAFTFTTRNTDVRIQANYAQDKNFLEWALLLSHQ